MVFMGSTEFALPALEYLHGAGFRAAAVVSTPARPKGRGLHLRDSPVAAYARDHGYDTVLTPGSLEDPAFLRQLAEIRAELFVVVAFRILPEEVFSMPRLGTVNLHASLLPKYRGPAPIHRAIEAGERETGITVFRIDRGVDTGNIVLRRATGIGPEETAPELSERLGLLGAEALAEACVMFRDGTVTYALQDHSCATRAPKLAKSEAEIDWSMSAAEIFNKIRAFKPFPGTFTALQGMRLGIEWASPVSGEPGSEPGTVCAVSHEGLDVQCGQGVLRVLRVKPEGRKSMDVAAFLNGKRVGEGVVLG